MAKKTTKKPVTNGADLAPVVTSPSVMPDMPDFLKRKAGDNKSPPAPVTSTAPAATPAPTKPRRFEVPMGMTEQEYDAKKAQLDPAPAPKAAASAKEAKVSTPRALAPAGSFKIADWSREEKLDARHVRRICRANAATLKPLWAGGLKHTFLTADRERVAKVIRDGFAAESKKTVKNGATKKKVKASDVKVPPPSETVWSGKAKKKDAPAPVTTSPKQDARKATEQLIIDTAEKLKKDAASKKMIKARAKSGLRVSKKKPAKK